MTVRRVIGVAAMGLWLGAGCTRTPVEALGRPVGGEGVVAVPGEVAGALEVMPLLVADLPAGQVVARVAGQDITLADIQKPLLEGYGLKVLMFQVQLKLARQHAATATPPITYTKADVDAELQRTFQLGFKDADKADYPALLEQLLGRTGLSRGEFDMVIEANTILRKIAEPQLKNVITEANLREAYNARFGQTVIIRHIQCANTQEAIRAKSRIAAGEKFEEVARTMSHNPKTAELGGELPVFSRSTEKWPGEYGPIPQGFRDWAFNAKEGDISDPIHGEGSYHILRLDRKMEPKVVKFEDYKEGLRTELHDKLMEQAVNALRQKLAGEAVTLLKIEDPVLRAQFEAKLAEQQKQQKNAADARQDILNRAGSATTKPGGATRPAPVGDSPFKGINGGSGTQGAPAGTVSPKVSPDAGSAGERPPASGSATGAADGAKK